MTEHISLDAHGLESALGILQREQTACVPTDREKRLYRWFNICVYATAVVFVLMASMGAMGEEVSDSFHMMLGLLGLVAGALMLGTIVLFFLNWGLIRKLYRHSQLRKRLRLGDYFAAAFSAERKTTAVGNVIALLTFIAGWLLILASFFAAVVIVIGETSPKETGSIAMGSVFVPMFLVGVSFISFRYMRRGKQRLDVVLRLQKTLTEQAGQGEEAKEVSLSPEEYNAIAALERQQIIRDREQSIASARKEADGAGYLCQSSRQMHLAKSKLPAELLVKVEGAIAELLVDPPAAAAANGSRTEKSTTMPVAGTGLRIEYDVDRQRQLVRLYDLRTERGTSVSAAGGANGLS
jgi:hypothetical protein